MHLLTETNMLWRSGRPERAERPSPPCLASLRVRSSDEHVDASNVAWLRRSLCFVFVLAIAGFLVTPSEGEAQIFKRFFGGRSNDKDKADASAKPKADDPRRLLEISVELAWLADPVTFPYYLEAKVDGRALEVRGYVPDPATHEHALRLARLYSSLPVADNVKEHRSLQVRPTRMTAQQLQRSVAAALTEGLPKTANQLKIRTHMDGKVVVWGAVANAEEKLQVSQVLRRLHGCTSVQNLTQPRSGPTPAAPNVVNSGTAQHNPAADGLPPPLPPGQENAGNSQAPGLMPPPLRKDNPKFDWPDTSSGGRTPGIPTSNGGGGDIRGPARNELPRISNTPDRNVPTTPLVEIPIPGGVPADPKAAPKSSSDWRPFDPTRPAPDLTKPIIPSPLSIPLPTPRTPTPTSPDQFDGPELPGIDIKPQRNKATPGEPARPLPPLVPPSGVSLLPTPMKQGVAPKTKLPPAQSGDPKGAGAPGTEIRRPDGKGNGSPVSTNQIRSKILALFPDAEKIEVTFLEGNKVRIDLKAATQDRATAMAQRIFQIPELERFEPEVVFEIPDAKK